MIREYGLAPYNTAVLHGGPGAVGSLAGMAAELSKYCGVIEPLQSKYNIPDLIEELNGQLASVKLSCALRKHSAAAGKVQENAFNLVAHSWGAWFALLYAAKYPNNVKQLILIGCPPLLEKYVPEIMTNRVENLTAGEQVLFKDLLARLSCSGEDKEALMTHLDLIFNKTDNYALFPPDDYDKLCSFDGDMYARVWPEAEALRRSGALFDILRGIKCSVTILHGELDPHPIAGVCEPLSESGIKFEKYIFPHCGHSPFKEKYVMPAFYRILVEKLNI